SDPVPRQVGEGERMMADLTRRLAKADAEDFELDKSSDYGTGSAVGVRNYILAKVLLGCYEAVMGHEFIVGGQTPESCAYVMKLFKRFTSLKATLNDKSATKNTKKRVKGAPKAKPLSAVPVNSVVQLDCANEILEFLYTDGRASQQAGRSAVREDGGFVKYVVAGILEQLHKLVSDRSAHLATTFGLCGHIARVIFHEFLASRTNEFNPNSQAPTTAAAAAAKKEKGKSIFTAAVECFYLTVQIVCEHYPAKIEEFLKDVIVRECDGSDDQLKSTMHALENFIGHFITDKIPLNKEAAYLIDCISLLSKLDESAAATHLTPWLDKVCKEQPIDDAHLARSVVRMRLGFERRAGRFDMVASVHQMKAIAADSFSLYGRLNPDALGEQEEEEEADPVLLIMNEKT
ncbi:FANCI solenoid 3-domain-containing protein, partial [Blyttiomyces helicus]